MLRACWQSAMASWYWRLSTYAFALVVYADKLLGFCCKAIVESAIARS